MAWAPRYWEVSRQPTGRASTTRSLTRESRSRSADAQYENAKLTREVAEIAVPEYEQGILKQDEATLMGAVKLAQNNSDRARAAIEAAEGRLAKIKQASRGTAEDLALEYLV